MFYFTEIKMTYNDILYNVLKKLKEQQPSLSTGDFLYDELKDGLMCGEFNFRYFLDDMETQGYIKITKQNITDWGEIQILPSGLNYINQYTPTEHTNINFKQFWDFVESKLIKNTDELLQAKRGADLHLQSEIEQMEFQKSLAGQGKRNCYAFMVKQVDFARGEVYRYENELEKRRILAMASANRIGGYNNQFPPVSNNKSNKENPEDEWKTEAIKKGLRIGTAEYHNFIQTKKLEQKAVDDEILRKKDFEFYVGKNNIYCPTIGDFKQQLAIQKLNPVKFKYMEWLWNEKVRYMNAKHYYDTWGERGTGINRTDLYGKIIEFINWEIEDGTSLPESISTINIETTPTIQSETEKYNLGDYALMQVYLSISGEGEAVTNTNKDKIANEYNLHGKRLYESFNRFSNSMSRTEITSKRSDKAKNERFEKVIKLLSEYPKALKRATDEQKMFISASQKQYE